MCAIINHVLFFILNIFVCYLYVFVCYLLFGNVLCQGSAILSMWDIDTVRMLEMWNAGGIGIFMMLDDVDVECSRC